jgi:hypothetical protein
MSFMHGSSGSSNVDMWRPRLCLQDMGISAYPERTFGCGRTGFIHSPLWIDGVWQWSAGQSHRCPDVFSSSGNREVIHSYPRLSTETGELSTETGRYGLLDVG